MPGSSEQPDRRDERRLIKAALEEASALEAGVDTARPGRSGDRIWRDALSGALPGYHLIRELHRGGQGVVYLAMQLATRRKVAIKVMREGPFAGTRDRTRFEREMQILAQLDHPGIVTIHDSGDAAGSFYFVMDYISGESLDDFVNGHGLTKRQILELFALICEAVQAAHLQGVIHRDLKPGNIRVNADGRPFILDFGLAKITGSGFTPGAEPEVMTQTGQFIGSLPWASPEQVTGHSARIDMRTDVYSLGILLFQLLTRHFPYDVVGPMREVMDRITESMPRRPRDLNPKLDDELETILLKCLAKERERRYQTAGELGRDIRRYLGGEPIDAKRDSSWYLIRKTMHRYRGAVWLGAGAFVALICFAITMSVLYGEAVAAQREAEDTGQKFINMAGLLDLFNSDRPVEMNLLDEFAASLNTDPPSDPALAAMAHAKVGNIYRNKSRFADAATHLRHAVDIYESIHRGESDPDLALALHDLAHVHFENRDYPLARNLFQQALDMRRTLFGEEHADVARSTDGVAVCLDQIGYRNEDAELLNEAQAMHFVVLELRTRLLGRDHEDVATTHNNIGVSLYYTGDHAEAARHFNIALEIMKARRGDNHPRWIATLHNLARCKDKLGQVDEAGRLLRSAVERKRVVLGNDDVSLATSLLQLAELLLRTAPSAEANDPNGQLTARRLEALEIAQEATTIRVSAHGPEHSQVMRSKAVVGQALVHLGRYELAETELLRAHAGLRRQLGDSHRYAHKVAERLFELYERWGKPDQAELYRTD